MLIVIRMKTWYTLIISTLPCTVAAGHLVHVLCVVKHWTAGYNTFYTFYTFNND